MALSRNRDSTGVNQEQWQQLRSVFHAALECDPAERRAFLDEACAGHPWLRTEVESLLASHARADDFIEKSALEIGAELLIDESQSSLVGRTIGPYQVRHEIGRGGMGVVYLAEDTRLKRDVALKALAPDFTQNDDRRQRLRREAQAAAALSHPGIATVYSLEEIGEDLYIVSEYIQGDTLRTELDRGHLAIESLLDAALEVAQALAAAHARGVVHRDLKPENLVRTPEGRIKILDFGLARFVEPAFKKAGQISTRLTEAGMLLGTPAYMSPEQLRGQTVDFRSDLFSFGVLVYELGCGVHPFEGSDPASTVARILESEPVDFAERNPVSPPGLSRIVARCLSKNPALRYQSTAALAADLERVRSDSIRADVAAEVRPRVREATSRSGVKPVGSPLTPRWWWQFHQVFSAAVFLAMLYPAWFVRQWMSPLAGLGFFFGLLVVVIVGVNLRMHLWFTSRVYLSELAGQRARLERLIRAADIGFSALLLSGAASVVQHHPGMATLLLAIAVANVVAFLIIEPATTRAAFRRPRSGAGVRVTPAKKNPRN